MTIKIMDNLVANHFLEIFQMALYLSGPKLILFHLPYISFLLPAKNGSEHREQVSHMEELNRFPRVGETLQGFAVEVEKLVHKADYIEPFVEGICDSIIKRTEELLSHQRRSFPGYYHRKSLLHYTDVLTTI